MVSEENFHRELKKLYLKLLSSLEEGHYIRKHLFFLILFSIMTKKSFLVLRVHIDKAIEYLHPELRLPQTENRGFAAFPWR